MNNITPPVGARDGNWVWDGVRWVCEPDCDDFPRRPPFSILQPGGVHSPFFPPPVTQPPWYPGANGGVSFAPPGQPPPNPIRGAFWWDGTSLWIFDGAAWDMVGPGGIITPPGTTFPPNPQPGEQFFDGHTLWIWDGNAWVPVSGTKTYVQATAPPHPNPGDLWFNGTQLFVWSGSAWNLVGPGAIVGPVPTTTHTFSMLLGAPSVAVAGGYCMLNFPGSPTIDTQGAFSTTTQQITPKVAGTYLTVLTGWGEGGTGQNQFYFLKNDPGTVNSANINNQMAVAVGGVNAATVGASMGGTGLTHMNGTTDFLRLWLYAAGTSFFPFAAQTPVIDMWLLP